MNLSRTSHRFITQRDKEIARQVIEKAVKNGLFATDCVFDQVKVARAFRVRIHCTKHDKWREAGIEDIIFDENDRFAKAFWGWGLNHTKHMQELSRAKNPYKYLERFL